MEVLEAIRTRRTVHEFTPLCPPRAAILQVLEAATWAPNFWDTEPWRFHVFSGSARDELGEVLVEARLESLARKGQDPSSPQAQARLRSERKVPLQAPVLIAVTCIPADHNPNVEPVEELEAVAIAVQNLMLAAHALGLATKWQTAGMTTKPVVRSHFGLREQDTLVGFILVGYAAHTPAARPRTPVAEKTEWRGWEGPDR